MLHVTFNLLKLNSQTSDVQFTTIFSLFVIYLLTLGIWIHLMVLLSGLQVLHDPQQHQDDLANNSVIIEGALDALAFNRFLSRIMLSYSV